MIQIKDQKTGRVLLEIDADTLEGRSFLNAQLPNADFSGMKLTKADFQGADLR